MKSRVWKKIKELNINPNYIQIPSNLNNFIKEIETFDGIKLRPVLIMKNQFYNNERIIMNTFLMFQDVKSKDLYEIEKSGFVKNISQSFMKEDITIIEDDLSEIILFINEYQKYQRDKWIELSKEINEEY